MKVMVVVDENKRRKTLKKLITASILLLAGVCHSSCAEAYTSGTITDTATNLSSGSLFGTSGNYTVKNIDNNTLTVNITGGTISNGNVTIDGNLYLNETGKLAHRTLNNAGTLTINGDFTSIKDLDAAETTGTPGTHRINGNINFNGDFFLSQNVKNIATLNTVTTMYMISGTTNMNGNVHFVTKADGTLSSGLNGLYITGSGTGLNITGNNKNVFLKAINRKADVVSANQSGVVNINTGGTTQIIGTLDVKGEGKINAVLSGTDSFWYGDEINGFKIFGFTLNTGTLNVTLNNGAEWSYFGDNGVGVNHYADGKGITQLTLNGGYVNLFDDYLHLKWQEYGLADEYDDIMSFKHDYVYIGNLKGDGGYFLLDLDSSDKNSSDMIYINDSTDSEAGHQYLQVHPSDNFDAISPDNTLRFATVGPGAADKITFNDTVNVQGKKLWDYKLLIGSEDYDINDPENDVYNAKASSLSDLSQVANSGAKNWFIYDFIKDPTGSMETAVTSGTAVYHVWREHDQLVERMGDLRHDGIDERGAWVRMKGSKMGRDGVFGFGSKYRQYEIGYDNIMKQTDKFTRYGGTSFSYTDIDNSYNQGRGNSEGQAVDFYMTQMGNKGHYLDMVFKVQHFDSDFTAHNRDGSKVKGEFDNTGLSLSAEYGRKKSLGSDGWYVEPQAQLILGYLGGSKFRTSNEIYVHQGGIKSALCRLGFNLGKDIDAKTNIYIKGNWLHEFDGRYKVTMHDYESCDSIKLDQSFNDTWFEYGIGAAIQTGKNNHIYFDVERSVGSDFKKEWKLNTGARWTF